jgi:Zn-dependent oligopeptidase
MKTGDNKDILNFMKDMSKDKRQAAILSAQTSLEALKDKEGISQKDYANKLAVLSQLAEFEKLGVELDSEEYKQFEAFNETLLTATSEKAKALRDSGKISKMIKNPALRRLLENQIKDKIGKAEGKEGTTAKDTVKITEE